MPNWPGAWRCFAATAWSASPARFVDPPEGPWIYEMQALGYNYRLTDLHAALGLSQLQRLDPILATRTAMAARYDTLLAKLPVTVPALVSDRSSAWHLYVVELGEPVRAAALTCSRPCAAAGVGVAVHYIPVHLQPYYRALGFKAGDYPAAEGLLRPMPDLALVPDARTGQQTQVVQSRRRDLSGALRLRGRPRQPLSR
jgi:dTDP-4-amino-4,6-dideoxygalactose transaminase